MKIREVQKELRETEEKQGEWCRKYGDYDTPFDDKIEDLKAIIKFLKKQKLITKS